MISTETNERDCAAPLDLLLRTSPRTIRTQQTEATISLWTTICRWDSTKASDHPRNQRNPEKNPRTTVTGKTLREMPSTRSPIPKSKPFRALD